MKLRVKLFAIIILTGGYFGLLKQVDAQQPTPDNLPIGAQECVSEYNECMALYSDCNNEACIKDEGQCFETEQICIKLAEEGS